MKFKKFFSNSMYTRMCCCWIGEAKSFQISFKNYQRSSFSKITLCAQKKHLYWRMYPS